MRWGFSVVVVVLVVVLVAGLGVSGCGRSVTPTSVQATATTRSPVVLSPAPTIPSATTVPIGAAPVVPAASTLPVGLQAVLGLTQSQPGVHYAWRVTADGVATREIPFFYTGVAVGELGSTFVFSDSLTGRVYVWHPGQAGSQEAPYLELPAAGRSGDQMALSPDERLLALVRTEWSGETPAEPARHVTRGYLVDLQSGELKSWDWVESAVGDDEVWTMAWDRTCNSIYVSFWPVSGGGQLRSYRYDLSTATAVDLTGLALVYDVGSDGQVVGPALVPPLGRAPKPLALWRDGAVLELPSDPQMFDPCQAWISDDDKTIVAWGWAEVDPYHPGEAPPLLEVLKLGEGGWAVSIVYTGEASLTGVGFEQGSDVFWFQAGSSGEQGVTDVALFALDTGTNEVSASQRLPAASGDYAQALAILGSECSGGT